MVEVRSCVRSAPPAAARKPDGCVQRWGAVACVTALFACGFPRPADVPGDDASCTDTRSDPLNCGECGRRCADLAGVDGTRVTCRDGNCQIADACLANLADCDAQAATGCEADLRRAETCGSCDVACGGAEPLCSADGGVRACSAHCLAGEAECSGSCADLASDRAHCGRCGHDCGGGACVAGQCQPVAVAPGRMGPVGLAVTADAIYWSETATRGMDGRIATCPLPRCTLAPRLITDARGEVGVVAVAGTSIFFSGCSGDSCDDFVRLYQCPLVGCPATPQIVASDPTLKWLRLAVGPTRLYVIGPSLVASCDPADCIATRQVNMATVFGATNGALVDLALDNGTLYVDAGADLRSCPEPQGCASPTVVTGSATVASPFGVRGGVVYWFTPFSAGVIRIWRCNATSCSPTLFASESDGVSELQVDDSGVYWLNATKGTIRHCPLSGCTGAPDFLANGLIAPKALTLGAGFVYWIEGNDINRVAKL